MTTFHYWITFFYQVGKKAKLYIFELYLLCLGIKIYGVLNKCLFPSEKYLFCCCFVLIFVLVLMSNKCSQHSLSFQGTVQHHLSILCFPETLELLNFTVES